MSTDIDEKVKALVEKIEKDRLEIAEEKAKIKKGWVTNCSLRLPNTTTSINIPTAGQDMLSYALSYLLMWEDYATKANEILGIKESLILGGSTIDQWIVDIKKRMSVLTLSKKQANLDTLELRAKHILSESSKRELEYEAIIKSLEL
jgi:predicted nucleotidyltransferase